MASDGSLFIFMSGFPTGDLHPIYIGPKTSTNALACRLRAGVVIAAPMTDETRNPGFAELRVAVHGLVLDRAPAMHSRSAPGKIERLKPYSPRSSMDRTMVS